MKNRKLELTLSIPSHCHCIECNRVINTLIEIDNNYALGWNDDAVCEKVGYSKSGMICCYCMAENEHKTNGN